MVKLEGIYAAVPTPFSDDGKTVDVENIKKQVERYVDGGLHGIVTTGTTGEFPALSVEEYKLTIKTYVEAVNKRLQVVTGIGANSTELVIELAQYAEKVGADAIMVVPPFYDPLTFKQLKKFCEKVCSSVGISVLYYNLPHATGVHLNAEQIRELGSIKNFDYMKDTSGDAKEHADLLTNPTQGFTAFNGYDTLTFFSLALGSPGVVWGVASLAPKECVEFYNTLAKEKDLVKAREQWKLLWALSDCLESVNYAAGIKAGHEIIGNPVGPLREPVLPLEKEEYEKLSKLLAQRKYK